MWWTWCRVKRTLASMVCALATMLVAASPAFCGFPGMCPVLGAASTTSEALVGGMGRLLPLLFLGLSSLILSEGPRARMS